MLVTNPPYGERLKPEDLDGLYALLGEKLKHVFTGYHAWIIGYRDEQFAKIGLAPSYKEPILNGSLECELREYVIFDGDMRSFRKAGGAIKDPSRRPESKPRRNSDDRSCRQNADHCASHALTNRSPANATNAMTVSLTTRQ